MLAIQAIYQVTPGCSVLVCVPCLFYCKMQMPSDTLSSKRASLILSQFTSWINVCTMLFQDTVSAAFAHVSFDAQTEYCLNEQGMR